MWGTRLLGHFLEPTQRMRVTQFEAVETHEVDVVFLGDSQIEYGLWSEWFPNLRVINRGIAGDTAMGVRQRLDTAIGRQRCVCLEIGTNDLSMGLTPARIAEEVEAVVAHIRTTDTATRIIVNSVLPRQANYRSLITALNERLASLAGTTYLDLWPVLATSMGVLRPEFTIDHLHLTGPGYATWVKHLRPCIDTFMVDATSGTTSSFEEP